jgi:hypothetical protein
MSRPLLSPLLLLTLLTMAPVTAAQTEEQSVFPERGEGVHIQDEARIINGRLRRCRRTQPP